VKDDSEIAVQFLRGVPPKKISRDYIREWLEKYSKSKQRVDFSIEWGNFSVDVFPIESKG